jgi:hypothetical protein
VTPAQRERAARRRGFGTICFLLAGLAALIAVFVLVALRVEILGLSQTMFTNCGTLAAPIEPRTPVERSFCDAALGDHRTFVIASFGVAALLAGGGVALKVSGRDPFAWHYA